MSLVAFNKGVSSKSKTRLSQAKSEESKDDENVSDFELMTRLKKKKIHMKLGKNKNQIVTTRHRSSCWSQY